MGSGGATLPCASFFFVAACLPVRFAPSSPVGLRLIPAGIGIFLFREVSFFWACFTLCTRAAASIGVLSPGFPTRVRLFPLLSTGFLAGGVWCWSARPVGFRICFFFFFDVCERLLVRCPFGFAF